MNKNKKTNRNTKEKNYKSEITLINPNKHQQIIDLKNEKSSLVMMVWVLLLLAVLAVASSSWLVLVVAVLAVGNKL